MRFCAVGGAGLLVNLAVTYTFVTVFGFWYFWAYIIGVLCGWTCSFVLNALFTFPAHRKSGYHKKYALFIASYIVIFVINAALVYLLTTLLGIHYLVSISASALTTTLLSFSFNKHVIYRP